MYINLKVWEIQSLDWIPAFAGMTEWVHVFVIPDLTRLGEASGAAWVGNPE